MFYIVLAKEEPFEGCGYHNAFRKDMFVDGGKNYYEVQDSLDKPLIYLSFLTLLEMFCFSTRIWSSCYVSWWSYRPDWNGQRCLYPKLCRRRKRGCYWWSVLYTLSYVFSMVIWRVIGSLECVTGGYATDDDIKNKCSWKSHFFNHLHLEGRASTKY